MRIGTLEALADFEHGIALASIGYSLWKDHRQRRALAMG